MINDHVVAVNTFLLIALKKVSSDMFEVDFHDFERALLEKTGGCVYKVIMLLKYLRDIKGGTLTQLWSHLLKVKFGQYNSICSFLNIFKRLQL